MADMDKAAILQRRARKVVKVETEEGDFYVRSLTVGQKNFYEAGNYALKKGKPTLCLDTADARLAVLVLCDAEGNRLFTDEDAAQVQHVDSTLLEAALKAAKELNGLTSGDAEEERKNSPTTPSDDTP